MKNYSKKDYSEKNSKKYKKSSDSNNYSRSSNSTNDNNFTSKKHSFRRKPTNNKNQFNQLKSKDQNEDQLLSSKRRNVFNKSNFESPNKKSDMNLPQVFDKKHFEDWIWGKHSVYEALVSERPINRIWCTSEIISSSKFYILFKDLKSKGVLIEEVSWNRLSQLTFGASHQGVAIQLAHKKSISLNKLIDLSKTNSTNPIIVALDGITDPHNLGAIIRSAEAFNCKGIILPQRRSAGLTGTVAKVAAGALEHIPVCRVVNLNRSLEELKRNNFLTVGLSGDGQLPISRFNERSPIVVIIGSEDKGISLLTQKKCDYLLRIPLKGKTSSLNASVAAAISLFHITSK